MKNGNVKDEEIPFGCFLFRIAFPLIFHIFQLVEKDKGVHIFVTRMLLFFIECKDSKKGSNYVRIVKGP